MQTFHTIHHLQAAASNLVFQELKTLEVLLSTHTHRPTNAVCSTPISSHNKANKRFFTGCNFTKFTILTTSFKTGKRKQVPHNAKNSVLR